MVDKQMEKRKCLARELSDLIIYAVAVPFDHESKFNIFRSPESLR